MKKSKAVVLLPKLIPLLAIIISIAFLNSCKRELTKSDKLSQDASIIKPNVPDCGQGYHWDFTLKRCVPNCDNGYVFCASLGYCIPSGQNCPPSGSDTITIIKNPNNPYDYTGLQHNNGVTYLLNNVNPYSPTLTNDILHYTKVYGGSIDLDTSGFDSWYNYATAQGYFYLYDTVYVVSPNPLNTKLYSDGRIGSSALNYLNSINNAIDNVISDTASPSPSLYSQVANQLIVIESNIKNDVALTSNERTGLLEVCAINRYTGAYWAN